MIAHSWTKYCPTQAGIISVYALFQYKYPVTKLIAGLKFSHQLKYAQALGEIMAEYVPIWYGEQNLPGLIVPVPLHPLRMRERGFNQALEIARPVSKKLSIPIDYLGTTRSRHTARQSDLPARKRRENIKRAFVSHKDYSGQHIVIVDDVMTTGQTVGELASVLMEAGAKQVDVWCCTRSSR